jgi:hypothetical protein
MKAIWVHADCLHRNSPAYTAHPHSPSLYVWDDAELTRAGWSLKRIGFIYECLLDLPVEIRRGDPIIEMHNFAQETGCEGIVTMATPDPHLQAQAKSMNAEILPQQPFVEVKGSLDLKRFSRYWQKVEKFL